MVLWIVVCVILLVNNLMRAPLGQAMMAIRESQVAARSMGVDLARVKLVAFSLSAALTGLAGGLYAHAIRFVSPDQFGISLSIELLVVIFVGGIGTVHGVVFGAVFIIVLPQLISQAKDLLPAAIGGQPGLQAAAYALLLLLFILYEPQGLAGIWRRIKHYISLFPYYRRGSQRRVKAHARAESW